MQLTLTVLAPAVPTIKVRYRWVDNSSRDLGVYCTTILYRSSYFYTPKIYEYEAHEVDESFAVSSVRIGWRRAL